MAGFNFDFIEDFSQALVPQNVSIVEFAESDQWCGIKLFPRQRILLKLIYLEDLDAYEESVLDEWIEGKHDMKICPMIRERTAHLKERGYKHFRVIQMVGGRRSGKGLMTSICIARKVWELVQSGDPGEVYGIDSNKDIYIPVIAAKQQQAKDNQYGDIQAAITNCQPLQKYIKKVREEAISIYTPSDIRKEAELKAKGVEVVRDIAKIRVTPVATSSDTIRGIAAIGVVFDEMAFGMEGDSRRSNDAVWTAAVPSLAQFKKHSFAFCNSSPYTKTGIFFDLYKASQELEDGFPKYPEHLMLQFPSWEMYRDYERDPIKSKSGPVITYEDVAQEEKQNPEKFKVEYRGHFAETVDAFLDPERVDEMFTGNFNGRELQSQFAGVALYEYRGHADPSNTTANFGFAMAHLEYVDEHVLHPETGEPVFRERVPHVVFDLIDAFYPSDMPHNVIDYELVMEAISTYILHFRPKVFTFDQFSVGPIISNLRKKLHEKNIYDTRVSELTATLGTNRAMWDSFKAALYLNRVHAPNPKGQTNQRSLELVREEMKFLIERGGKVMKQDIGAIQTNDLAICCANLVHSLIGHELAVKGSDLGTRLAPGSQGGYPIKLRANSPFADVFEGYGKKRNNWDNPLRGALPRGRGRGR